MANVASSPSGQHPSAAPVTESPPVFVIDASGRVVATNRSACIFWATGNQAMTGLAFAQLFEPEGTLDAADTVEAQWTKLRTLTLESWASLTARTLQGARPSTWVRLERSIGGAGTYIALVRPQSAH